MELEEEEESTSMPIIVLRSKKVANSEWTEILLPLTCLYSP